MINSLVNTPWIAYSQSNHQAKLRLFCFPYAGGSAMVFRNWQDAFPSDVEICPVQLPGRGTRLMEVPFTQIYPLVEAAARNLLPYLDKPFAFFGHSLGALISFELARYLRREYRKNPVHLFASARQAPHIPDPSPMHALSEQELLHELQRLNGTPKEVLENSEMMQLLMPIVRADLAIDEVYVCTSEAPLECPITVFGGLQDPETSPDILEAWKQHTNTFFSLQMFPGDHFFLNTSQSLLLQSLSTKLQQYR